MDYRIKEILLKIDENISQPMKIKPVSESKGLSISYFQHLFKKEVGMSFTNYLKKRRLEKAKKLLQTTDLSIKQIQVKIGYSDLSHFLCSFKQTFQITPTKFRKNFRESDNLQVNSRIH